MSKTTAVVTMVYNEEVFLPLWARYYADQFGEASCYVIDHGSDDASSDALGKINIIRIPRSPMDDKKRANFISNFCSALLEWHDSVIYTDVDEFLIPDPESYNSLRDFTDRMVPGGTITTIGLNVVHLPALEPELDLTNPILGQRRWVRFNSAMCKPLVTTVPIRWVPGFHSSDQRLMFDRLYLFHLHQFDLPTSLARLSKTRTMPWADGAADNHQRWQDEKYEQMLHVIAGLPRIDACTFREDDVVIGPCVDWIKSFVENNPKDGFLFYSQREARSDKLLRIPERFLGFL